MKFSSSFSKKTQNSAVKHQALNGLSILCTYWEEVDVVIFNGEHTVPREEASIPQHKADEHTKVLPLSSPKPTQ
jgi:hypothetical protein